MTEILEEEETIPENSELESSATEEKSTAEQNTQPEEKQEDDKEKNWKAFLQKRKEEQEQYKKSLERTQQLEEENAKNSKNLEDMKIAFEALLEKRNAAPLYEDEEVDDIQQKIKKEVERIVNERESQRTQQEEKDKLAREERSIQKEMPDLIEVCSQENLAYLEYYYPEIATPLSKMPPGYEKTKLAYEAVKKHVKRNKTDEKKIDQNLSKPKSVHSSISNESQKEEGSYVQSDQKRQEVWNKMQRLISGLDEE